MGVESVIHTPSLFNPSSIAGEVAEDMTSSLVDQLLEMSAKDQFDPPEGEETNHGAQIASLKNLVEQLQLELSNTRSELEFSKAESNNLQKQNEASQTAITSLQKQVEAVVGQVEGKHKELADQKKEKDSLSSSQKQLLTEHTATKEELERMKEQMAAAGGGESLNQEIAAENAALKGELKATKEELEAARKQAEDARALQSQIPEGDQQAALQLANQQVAQFNTQMAHLYAQLTLARTELEQYKAGTEPASAGPSQADVDKQNSQIADLVSDIRHLQLDLEYHQQKLDQLIDEKQAMMQAMNAAKQELTTAKQQIEEKDQLLRHKEIDLARMSQEQSTAGPSKEVKLEEQLMATRSEVAAKDSALIVSHYELHKEKLMRDRLEQKNLKLMDRLQKLMMVVETQRKENSTLERKLFTHEQMVEDKDKQLKEVTHKAKQLQRVFKAKAGKTPRGGPAGDPKQMSGNLTMEMSSFSQGGLPAI
jgi:chromosome segregation ATPase